MSIMVYDDPYHDGMPIVATVYTFTGGVDLVDDAMKDPAYYLRLFLNADLMLNMLKMINQYERTLPVTNLINSIEGNANDY